MGKTSGVNPELATLRQFSSTQSYTLAEPETPLTPNCIGTAVPFDTSAATRELQITATEFDLRTRQNSDNSKRRLHYKRRMYKRLNVCVDQLQDDVIKILVIGDAGVGKTSFVQKYVYDVFSDKYKCTIGFDSVTKKVTELNQKPVNLQLQFWDIAGQDRFPLLTRAYYKYTRGCLIIFDLTNPESFNDVRKWKASLDNNLSVPCLLVANKVDLESERKVPPSDIERLVTELNFFQFTETSVKTGLMVEESVMYLVDVVLGNSPSTYTPSDFEHVDLREIRDLDTSQTKNGKKKCAICS